MQSFLVGLKYLSPLIKEALFYQGIRIHALLCIIMHYYLLQVKKMLVRFLSGAGIEPVPEKLQALKWSQIVQRE